MADKPDDLLMPLDQARRSLYVRLRAAPPEALTQRPASGDWSVLENVRHLLYAERRHFGRVLPKGFAWHPIGLPTGGVPRRTGAGTASTDDLAEVLAAWDEVHRAIRLDMVEREQAVRAGGAELAPSAHPRALHRAHARIAEAAG